MKNSSQSHLRLSHHRHTGHVLPRHTTSYPVLIMMLLCVGVFLGSWTHMVTAVTFSKSDSYTVNARVPGPAPTVAATIDSPKDGEKFTSTPISVSGTCPTDTYVVLYRNNFMSGVALCDALGKYHLTSDLFVGRNDLKATVFNFTDVAGPDSDIVTVYYNPPAPVTNPEPSGSGGGSTSKPSSPNAKPLLLKSDFSFQGYYIGSEIAWQLIIEGGDAPYAVAVDWGDGTRGLVSRSAAGSFVFKHTYKKSGGYHGSYVPIFTATDANGQETSLQLLAVVTNRPSPQPAATTGGGNTLSGLASIGGENVARFLKYIWPSYAIVVLMLISFWLGERREYQYLRPQLRKRHHA
jgi:hypothetical protein